MKNISKRNLIIFAFIPLVLDLLFILLANGNGVVWTVHIPILLLLAIIGISFISDKKLVQRLGIGALIVLTLLLSIIGYYDYLQWFSTIVGVVLLIYFVMIGMAMKKLSVS